MLDLRDEMDSRTECATFRNARSQSGRPATGDWGFAHLVNGQMVGGWIKFIDFGESGTCIDVMEPAGFLKAGQPPFIERIIPFDSILILEATTMADFFRAALPALLKLPKPPDDVVADIVSRVEHYIETGVMVEPAPLPRPVNLFVPGANHN